MTSDKSAAEPTPPAPTIPTFIKAPSHQIKESSQRLQESIHLGAIQE
jgi:hypothetical protein